MTAAIKICGLNDQSSVCAVIRSKVEYAGFVYHQKSPRHVSIDRMAQLRNLLPATIKSVVVLVNPDDKLLAEIANEIHPDFFQLHGDEIPQRLFEIRTSFPHIKLIKAITVLDTEDIQRSLNFYNIADFILFDAKPTNNNMGRGGNGISFDWNILNDYHAGEGNYLKQCNWFLSGGLNAKNISTAIARTRAEFVDVSSGVESSVGIKNAEMIEEFVRIVRSVEL